MRRYFNPIGAHPAGWRRGPARHPNNLFPFSPSSSQRERLSYSVRLAHTRGSRLRDYIHVGPDLALGHVTALRLLPSSRRVSSRSTSGTACATSVELVKAYEEAPRDRFPYRLCGRRSGRHRGVLRLRRAALRCCAVARKRAT